MYILSIFPAESYHEFHPPAYHQKARELCKKAENGRSKIDQEKLKIEGEYAQSKAKVKILKAMEFEDHKREFNIDGQNIREMDKTTDE